MATEQVTLLADMSFCPSALDAVTTDLQVSISLSSTSDTKEAYFFLDQGGSLDAVLDTVGKKDGTEDLRRELTSTRDNNKYTVGTRLSAIPLVRKGDYVYCLDLWLGGSRGLSLADIADTIGLGDITNSISESMPFVDSALSGFYARHVSGSLVYEEGRWRFGD